MRSRYDFSNYIRLRERSTDPSAPPEGQTIIWMSDGTGTGDDGDVISKGQAGGTTKYNAISDHSAGS